jgi:lysozyme family protein
MTEDTLIDAIFDREGRTFHVSDQPTGPGGITLPVLREVKPGATLDDLKALTLPEARDVVQFKLRQLAQVHGFYKIQFEPLRLQMLDFAYNSGPSLAIRWFQRVLGVPRSGRMDDVTVAAIKYPDFHRIQTWIHQSVIAARLQMVDMSTDGTAIDKKFEEGLENRALAFSLLVVP